MLSRCAHGVRISSQQVASYSPGSHSACDGPLPVCCNNPCLQRGGLRHSARHWRQHPMQRLLAARKALAAVYPCLCTRALSTWHLCAPSSVPFGLTSKEGTKGYQQQQRQPWSKASAASQGHPLLKQHAATLKTRSAAQSHRRAHHHHVAPTTLQQRHAAVYIAP